MQSKDKYYTPPQCYEKLPIDWSMFYSALEPAAGDGRIARFLFGKVKDVQTCEIDNGIDFFNYEWNGDLILTNPPFSLSMIYTERCVAISNTCIMLHRLGFLASKGRKDFMQSHEPCCMFVLSNRPSFIGKGTDNSDYAWICWDRTNRLPRGIFHI